MYTRGWLLEGTSDRFEWEAILSKKRACEQHYIIKPVETTLELNEAQQEALFLHARRFARANSEDQRFRVEENGDGLKSRQTAHIHVKILKPTEKLPKCTENPHFIWPPPIPGVYI